MGHTQAVYGLAFDPLAGFIYSGSADGMLVQWKMTEEDGTLIYRHNSSIYTVEFFDQFVWVGTRDSHLLQVDPRKMTLVRDFDLQSGAVFDVFKSKENVLVLTENGILWVFDNYMNPVKKVPISQRSLRNITPLSAGFAVASSDGKIHLLGSDFLKVGELNGHNSSVFAVLYLPEQDMLLSGGRDAVIRGHLNKLLVKNIPAHQLHIHRFALNPDLSLLASCSMDKTIKLWECNRMELLKVIDFQKHDSHLSSVNKILWIDKNTLISCSDDRRVKCFEIKEK